GVYGQIADDNTVERDAPRGAVLHARVLWFLSELPRLRPRDEARAAAEALCRYYGEVFLDAAHGGIMWTATAAGEPLSDRKQTYAQAFGVYAFSAYALAFGDAEARGRALAIAELLEGRVYDQVNGGYVEAFARDWSALEDMRLSERDLNAPKAMNTHLHVLEAYTALHRLVGDERTASLLAKNIDLFSERFIEPRGGRHVSVWYSMDWRDLRAEESYGHDIEASWLLYEAAEVLGDPERLARARSLAISLARSALEKAVGPDGGVVYERHDDGRGLDGHRHWWPQAEALVGFYNAYQLTGDARFEDAAARVWAVIKAHQIARPSGEWLWLSTADAPARGPYKAGRWKGPYHNGRAMMEMIRRLERAPA
ncbi:MAG: AGE family epimerase/isomerase, partial [Caulobacterales bacterium]|nr:AGE family epimerase/isomerase [Caulobacterales bacterium]